MWEQQYVKAPFGVKRCTAKGYGCQLVASSGNNFVLSTALVKMAIWKTLRLKGETARTCSFTRFYHSHPIRDCVKSDSDRVTIPAIYLEPY